MILFNTDDGGDITITDGLVSMGGGLDTAVYLSLFGGNVDDDGTPDNAATWWGNIGETQPAALMVSETQNLLKSLPATSGNLQKLERAAKRDLDWFLRQRVASSVKIRATLTGVNRVQFVIDITAIGKESRFTFTQNWKATND